MTPRPAMTRRRPTLGRTAAFSREPKVSVGVTLIETLAALAILGTVGMALSRAWTLSMELAGRASARATSAALAEEKLADLVAASDFAKAEDSGDFEDQPAYQWKSELAEWSTDNRLRQLTVTVTWKRRNAEYQTSVSTLVDTQEGTQ